MISGNLTLIALQGTVHTLSPKGDRSVRVSQPIGAGNFTVETAYKSRLSSNNVWQGVSFHLGNRTVLDAVRRIHGVDYVQVTLVDSKGVHLLSSERIRDTGAWYPMFRATRIGDVLALSWSVDAKHFSVPVLTSGGRDIDSFAVATGNEPVGSKVLRHVTIVSWVQFRP